MSIGHFEFVDFLKGRKHPHPVMIPDGFCLSKNLLFKILIDFLFEQNFPERSSQLSHAKDL